MPKTMTAAMAVQFLFQFGMERADQHKHQPSTQQSILLLLNECQRVLAPIMEASPSGDHPHQ